MVIFSNKAPVKVYRNMLSDGGHWLRLELRRGSAARIAPDAIGALVTVTAPSSVSDWALLGRVDGGTNYQSQGELAVHVGLGAHEVVDVRVDWTNGTALLLRGVRADRRLSIVADERCDLDADGRVDSADLGILLGQWGPCESTDPHDLNCDGDIDWEDVLVLLRNWRM